MTSTVRGRTTWLSTGSRLTRPGCTRVQDAWRERWDVCEKFLQSVSFFSFAAAGSSRAEEQAQHWPGDHHHALPEGFQRRRLQGEQAHCCQFPGMKGLQVSRKCAKYQRDDDLAIKSQLTERCKGKGSISAPKDREC